ncbi:MAG TPA: hemerythrin domain-containing protein [Gammaproteobacteria bacterium]|nr:hemerythrin domain-containing protein [Gammaproteobacteria bacterium]
MIDPFKKPAPSFDDPLGMLMACHERILGHCETLLKLPSHLAEHGCDDEASQAARRIHTYFSTAGRDHHEDEEQDIFPRVAHSSAEVAEAIDGLRGQHARMDEMWTRLEPLLARPDGIEDIDGLRALTEEFAALYREHIATENALIRDQLQHLLSEAQLREIGRSMAQRRNVDPDAL